MGIFTGILSLIIKGKFLQLISGILNGGVNAYLSILVTSAIITYYLSIKGGESKGTPTA